VTETRADADDGDDANDSGGDGDAVETTAATNDDDGGIRVRELVLLVVAVLAIAGMVFFGLRWKELHDEDVKRQDVEEAAGQFLNALFEWDGATIDADFDRIMDFATGQFADEAEATFADDATRQQLREKQAASRAEELDIFVRSIDGDQARVFAVVDVTAVNEDFPDRRADTVRVEIGMTKVDGQWKVDDVNLLDGLNLGLPSGGGADSGAPADSGNG
jgi:Mce-associated membrane protein